MSSNKGGRPQKRKRNITGLKNQLKPSALETAQEPTENCEIPHVEEPVTKESKEDEIADGCWMPEDILRTAEYFQYEGCEDSEDEEEVLEQGDWDDEALEDENLQDALFRYAAAMDGDIYDEDWVPEILQRKKKSRRKHEPKERAKTYATGPDIARKSARSQRRHKSKRIGQDFLGKFGFTGGNCTVLRLHTQDNPVSATGSSSSSSSSILSTPDIPIRTESVEPELGLAGDRKPSVPIRAESEEPEPGWAGNRESSVPIRQESIEPVLTWDGDSPPDLNHPDVTASQREEFVEESWEEELDERVGLDRKAEIRNWSELREQIKNELAVAKKKHLPLLQINQLLILRNFATLRLKNMGRIRASQEIALQWHEKEGVHFARHVRQLARHYQIFEQLPREKRGGLRTSCSLLSDENTRNAVRNWLTAQKAGNVTPKKFQIALNETILPSLGIQRKSPLCIRTARRWLTALGWRLTVLRKGVYLDVFLPAMAAYEQRMARYEGPELKRVLPTLQPGEKEVIAEFHDESAFSALEYKSKVWLAEGQTILQKKTRGRIIHVSDLINQVNGPLVCRDADGKITRDARKVIYPGSNGDAWWDTEQLLVQMKEAISIFDEAHPDCQALFIFDQSSAHASLGPDALRAWDMNKSDGGRQRKQRDTVIPQLNPYPEFRGQTQKMTLPDGKPKGLQRVLVERGFDVRNMRAKCSPVCPFENNDCCMARLLSKQEDFTNQLSMLESLITDAGHYCIFLPKFHCELNPIEMYWGWVKYRFREIPKKTFQEAKDAAFQYLDACPVDMIRRFINQSFHWMSAYRLKLTGKAAEWAVKKQKTHRSVSASAMMHLDTICQPTT
ncbi:hypothetical protein BT96DRAFT_957397 [Gymnopus androsaceus JB14]|uniref:Tc1-like transposase DDE domain-containing protein n=1 Tax=Gymnopus androsaceus JB14 TaxID=1447944 RepID=A0A6A4HJK2_9AGAR|nr:hypothetical protein BT96DRAFT_957397 [Gymnopus androsaceus JB14]